MKRSRVLAHYNYGLAFALGLLPGLAGAAVISGSVTDPSGDVVAQARIVLFSRDNRVRWTATTNESGMYRLDNLPAGDYLIDASAIGLGAPSAKSVSVVAEDRAVVNIQLDLAQVRSQVVVTATGAAQSADEVARAIDVIHADEMDARNVFSLADSIRTLPGLRVQTVGGPGGLTRVMFRGLRAQDAAVTIDGLRFRDAATTQGDSSSFLANLFPVNADRVEVLRGTGSSLYGTHAVGGVVNVVTDEGGGPFNGEVRAEGGGLGMARGLAKFSGGSMAGRLRYSLGMQHFNVTRGINGDHPFRDTSGQGHVQMHVTPAVSLSGRIWGGDSFITVHGTPYVAPSSQLPARGSIQAVAVPLETQRRIESGLPFSFGDANLVPDLNNPDNRRSSRFIASSLLLSHQLSPRASYRVSYQKVVTRRQFEDGPGGVRFQPLYNTFERIRGNTDTMQARVDVPVARWSLLSAGYELERATYFDSFRDFAPAPLQQTYQADASELSHSTFVHSQNRLMGDRLQISLSGRIQRFDLRTPEFANGISPYTGQSFASPPSARTGDAAVAYLVPRTSTKFRAHAGTGYRAPSLYERVGTSFFEGSFSAFGDPRLRPENTVSFDYGVDQFVANQRLRFSATHFYTELREVISFDFSGFLNPSTDPFRRSSGYINTGGGIARGVELSVEATPVRGSRVRASYTYANSDQRRSTARDNDFFSAPLISNHQFNATVVQRLTSRLDAALDVSLVSEYAALFSSRVFLFNGPKTVDLALHYAVPVSDAKRLTLFVKINNLFDYAYLENGFRSPGIWGTGGIGLRF
ncbi:MAG: TonB-dependent receptor [Bryobacteraceae bacterium]